MNHYFYDSKTESIVEYKSSREALYAKTRPSDIQIVTKINVEADFKRLQEDIAHDQNLTTGYAVLPSTGIMRG